MSCWSSSLGSAGARECRVGVEQGAHCCLPSFAGIYHQRNEDAQQAVCIARLRPCGKKLALKQALSDHICAWRNARIPGGLSSIREGVSSLLEAACTAGRRCRPRGRRSQCLIAQLCGYQEDWTRTTNHLLAGYVRYRKLDNLEKVKHTAEMFRELRLLAGEELVWSVVLNLLGNSNSEKLRRELMHLAPMPVSVPLSTETSEPAGAAAAAEIESAAYTPDNGLAEEQATDVGVDFADDPATDVLEQSAPTPQQPILESEPFVSPAPHDSLPSQHLIGHVEIELSDSAGDVADSQAEPSDAELERPFRPA